MHQVFCGVLLLVAITATINGQRHASSATNDGRPPHSKANPVDSLQGLVGRGYPAYGGYGNVPPNHLDVALPMSILDSDGALMLHLKDTGLWEKENAVRGKSVQASLMPSHLKSLEDEGRDEITPPEEPEDGGSWAADPKELLHKYLGNFDNVPDLTDRAENILEIITRTETENMKGVSFNMKDAFKRLFEKYFTPQVDGESSPYRREALKSPGVYFSLKELEENFEKMHEAMSGDDGLSNFVEKDSKGRVLFNIADIIKEEQTLEKQKARNEKVDELVSTESEGMNLNEKLAAGLRRMNVSVETAEGGGLLFNLNKTRSAPQP